MASLRAFASDAWHDGSLSPARDQLHQCEYMDVAGVIVGVCTLTALILSVIWLSRK